MASASHFTTWMRSLLSGFLVLTLATRILAADMAYCSSENTGLYFAAVYNQYQSNGACHDTCKGSYAVAVLQGYYCWCTNYAPASTVSTYSCNSACPGFGSDWCGNPSAGYYAYFLIDGAQPLGTTGTGSSTIAATSSSLVSTTLSRTGSPTSILSISYGGSSSLTFVATPQSSRFYTSVAWSITTLTETSTEHPVSSSSIASSPSSVSSSPPSSSSSSTHTTVVPSQVTATQSLTEVYTSVTTVTGQVRTVLITPTPTTDSTLGSSSSVGGGNGGGGVSPGKVVGIVVGVALGIGLLIGLGVWYWLRRRHQRNMAAIADDAGTAGNANNGIPSRQVSQMSSAGLLSKGPRINTSGLPPGNGPKSAQSTQFNRQSLGTDQRLNPYAIYAQEESRHSNVSLQDNHDYSRQLRVANPDP